MAMESSVTCNSRVAAVDLFPRGRPVHDVPESLSSGSDVRPEGSKDHLAISRGTLWRIIIITLSILWLPIGCA
jgi:hypothetical protein